MLVIFFPASESYERMISRIPDHRTQSSLGDIFPPAYSGKEPDDGLYSFDLVQFFPDEGEALELFYSHRQQGFNEAYLNRIVSYVARALIGMVYERRRRLAASLLPASGEREATAASNRLPPQESQDIPDKVRRGIYDRVRQCYLTSFGSPERAA